MKAGSRESGLGIRKGEFVRAVPMRRCAAVVNGSEGSNQSLIPNAQSRHRSGGAK
ncbi:hypothetical protein CFBP7900_12270 [Xanthomonas hortorum pv. carotae]|uniref:Uncharacterized protein n=1 Tax=Xanthomonas hortorum pv. carotae TaxID=487904 RepID=A0A6V7CLH6_9XANT|nr:hypothetical protein CFBP7900_12270 [Xanthomonas hortorum pv. carotae]CAD0318748.1 hypothetical protein CFBP7900_12270 [Xanthomonas hortorum pv. carotae]